MRRISPHSATSVALAAFRRIHIMQLRPSGPPGRRQRLMGFLKMGSPARQPLEQIEVAAGTRELPCMVCTTIAARTN